MKILVGYLSVLMFCCCSGLVSGEQTINVPLFEDGFETHDCGDPIDYFSGTTGKQWQHIGSDFDYHTVDCTFACTGNASLKTQRIVYGYSEGITWPYGYAMKGMTTVFEHDVFITKATGDPNWGGGGFSADVGAGTAPMTWYVSNYPGSTWLYRTGSDNQYVNSGIAAPKGKWVHIRVELYDDLTYSFWVKPEGYGETLIANKVAWAGGWGLGQAFRGAYFPEAESVVYWDNTVQYWRNTHSQGYPNINETTTNIIVDGNVDLVNEWAGAAKVASKASGELGNFIPWVAGGRSVGLSDNTAVDFYMTHDSQYFYISGISNNIGSGQFILTDNGRLGISFVFDSPNHNSYSFEAFAAGADPCSNPQSLAFTNFKGYPALPPMKEVIDINDFYQAGGKFWYTYNSTTSVMNVEIKVPFIWMPDFQGIEPGKKVEVFFFVCETGPGKRGTTHQIGEMTPYFPSAINNNARTPGVGVSFPICGDPQHPYPAGDMNQDCTVNLFDLAMFSSHWLECGFPNCDSPGTGSLVEDVFSDTFENYALSSNPVPGAAEIGSWAGSGGIVTVQNAHASSGIKGLEIIREIYGSFPTVMATSASGGNAEAGSDLVFSMDRLQIGGREGQPSWYNTGGVLFGFTDGDPLQLGISVGENRFPPTNYYTYRSGSSVINSDVLAICDVWTTWEVVMHFVPSGTPGIVSGTYDVYITNKSTGQKFTICENIAMAQNLPTDSALRAWIWTDAGDDYSWGGDVYGYYDNVKIKKSTPLQCGQDGYVSPPGDFNTDCHVNIFDLAELTENWLFSSI
ncbi:MAG: hypothetical protein A2Y12_11560 [Planctomycetes bacterium GWF2_42_9]|nr:MAG: hypothetical protein A2Y12_11560 [Planctomycetes bacterium GWF2_42_9]